MLVLARCSAAAGIARVGALAGVECCLALWAARAPEREPLGGAAREIRAAMPGPAKETLRALDDRLPEWPLYAVNVFYRIGARHFGEALAQLAGESPRRVAAELVLGSVGCSANPDAEHADDPIVQLVDAGRLSAEAERKARPLLQHPEKTVFEIIDVLRAFWRAGFGQIWERQRHGLGAVARTLNQKIETDPAGALTAISPRAVFDVEQDRLTFVGSAGVGGTGTKIVDCARLERLDVVLSYWLRRRVVLAQAAGRVALCLGGRPAVDGDITPERLSAMLATLGGSRRFEIFCRCLERPRTTSELATLLGVTPAPISRHLKELESQGLVVGQRLGRRVEYTAAIEVLYLVGRQLQRLPQEIGKTAVTTVLPWNSAVGQPSAAGAASELLRTAP